MNISLGKALSMIFRINIVSAGQQLIYVYIHSFEKMCFYKVQENYIPPRDHMGEMGENKLKENCLTLSMS